MSSFKAGDCVRNIAPYWGEAAYYLIKEEVNGFHAVSTGSKHGRGGIACFFSHSALDGRCYDIVTSHYALCPKHMRVWLAILGTFVAMKNWVRERV